MKLLVLAPHTDDAELGCGGTISRFVAEGWDVQEVAFSTGTATRAECQAAAEILGIQELNILDYPTREFGEHRQEILQNMIDIGPADMVLCPSWTDMHQDHRVIAQEALRAFRQTTLLGYEMPWNEVTRVSTLLVRLQHKNILQKVAAFRRYPSQANRVNWDTRWIWSLAQIRGLQAGAQYAESFEVMRWVM